MVDVDKFYGDLHVLKSLSLDVYRGDVFSLIGPSGSGKSTALRCINALEPIQGGEVWIGDEKIDFANEPQKRKIRQRIGIVFQSYNLFPHLSVEGNIILGPTRIRGVPLREAKERARELLAQVGLEDKVDAYPEQLSGGQRQRVAIARALAMEPEALLLDEVTSALDPELVREVVATIRKLADQGVTMVYVGHDMNLVREISSQVAFLEKGQVVEMGPVEEVFASSNPRLRRFLEEVG